MKTRLFHFFYAALALVIWISSSPASADSTDKPLAEAQVIPAPVITVKLSNTSIGDALSAIAKQSRWGLAITAPDALLAKKITLILPPKPADEIVAMVLADSGLESQLKQDVLFIKAKPAPVPAEKSPAGSGIAQSGAMDKDVDIQVKIADDQGTDPLVIDVKNLGDFHKKMKDTFGHGHRKNTGGTERVKVGGSVEVAKGETVSEAVAVGGSTTISGTVNGDAVAVGGDTLIKAGAHVSGDAVSVGGTVTVQKGASVEGEAVAVGGKLVVEPGAEVKGDRVSVDIPFNILKGIGGVFGALGSLWILITIVKSLFIFLVALVIVWLVPERVAVTGDYVFHRIGWSLLSGLLIMLGFLPLCILLIATIIGIPVVPLLVLFLAAIIIFGMTAVLTTIGYKIPIFNRRKTPIVALLMGSVVFMLVGLIPFVGPFLMMIAALAAAGATFLSRFGGKSLSL